jgi:hypothetical protein
MNAVKEDVQTMLNRLPADCTLEDVQYHLYVMEKVKNGIGRAEREGAVAQEAIEQRFESWLAG